MRRLQQLFDRKKGHILNVYFTAGFPRLNSVVDILRTLERNGADIVELGIPYSDPLADGEVIQASSARALQNGMNIAGLLQQLAGFRKQIGLPVILMGYLNPLLQYGFDRFCREAATAGVDGLIVPDIPVFEYEKEYKKIVEDNGLDFIFLVTPETPEDRVRKLDQLSSGFLYAVSSSSVTGTEKNFAEVEEYLSRLKKMGLKNPVLAGFGIKDKQTFEAACRNANGAIIGSAYIRAIEHADDIEATTGAFLDSILK